MKTVLGTLFGTVTEASGPSFRQYALGQAVSGVWQYETPLSDETLFKASTIRVTVASKEVAAGRFVSLSADANGLPVEFQVADDPDMNFKNGVLTVHRPGSGSNGADTLTATITIRSAPQPPSNLRVVPAA